MFNVAERPPMICAATPGSVDKASAMLSSGSLPRSSDEIVSTIMSELFLAEMASSIPRRIPVTVTVLVGCPELSTCVAGGVGGVVVCCAPALAATNISAAHAAATGFSLKVEGCATRLGRRCP